jgi:hypothetical protein
MARPVVAIVTGFTRDPILVRRSFAPLRSLKRKGLIDRIIYVTWDTGEIDEAVKPVLEVPEMELVRIPQPDVVGVKHEKSFIYQRRNIEAALARVTEPDALVLKTRPDFIFEEAFLASKILAFDFFCAPAVFGSPAGAILPPSPFSSRIWIPWADGSQPFFYEDGVCLGLKADIAKLIVPETEKLIMTYGDEDSHWIVHVLRYLHPFLKDYPILDRYLLEFDSFVMDTAYRNGMVRLTAADPYFWHLVVAHAWILATSFHVDCGQIGQMKFYPGNHYAKQATRILDQIETSSPYNAIYKWADGTQPGGLHPCIIRNYARLVDDNWQKSIFTTPVLRDLTPENLIGVLERVRGYRSGVLAEAEDAFYGRLRQFYQSEWLSKKAA